MERVELSWEGGLSPEEPPISEPAERFVTSQECEGHFGILPAFRMLRQLADQLARRGTTPKTVRMRINDILPEGVTYYASYNYTGSWAQRLILTRQRDISITSSSAPLTFLRQSDLFAQRESSPFTDGMGMALDRQTISTIIPQGDNLQFIDAVLKPDSAQPDVLLEAVHRIIPEDYAVVGTSEYFYFDKSRLLEGFGQLAYVHFYQQLHPTVPTIPFFKDVAAYFDPAYQPHVGETICYQLTHFETDFADRGDKGTGTIRGRVMAANRRYLIANFSAKVGVMEQTRLQKLADMVRRQSSKPDTPEQN